MAIRIKIRRGTSAAAAANNPILAEGEIGIVTNAASDDVKMKIGDGVTAWNALSFFDPGNSGAVWGSITGTITNQTDVVTYVAAQLALLVDSSPATLDTLNELAAALGDDPSFATTITNLIAAKQPLVNSAVVLTDAASIALTAIKHTLSTSAATRTFTISYTGDDITIEVTLSNTGAVYTFPVNSLCISEGVASGDTTCTLAGVSGDKYIIAIKKIGSNYFVIAKNFGQ